MQIKCAKCNHEYDDGLAACPIGGDPTPAPGTFTAQQTTSSADTAAGTGYTPVRTPAEIPTPAPVPDNSGATPLVLGILSLMIPIVGVVLGIIAIVMGGSQRQAYPPGTAHHGFGQAGWVLGIVGLVMQALLIVWFFTVIGFALNVAQDAMQYALPYSYGYDLF